MAMTWRERRRRQAGRRRHKVDIQQATETAADDGQLVPTWSIWRRVWVDLEPVRGREEIESSQVQGTVTHQVTMPYLEGVTTQMRIVYGARIFHVESVRNIDERNRDLELMVTEEV